MNKLIALLFFFASSTSLFAQYGYVKGEVHDQVGPLPGATVYVKGNTMLGTSTDLDGLFQLNKIPAGKVVLVVTYIGFNPVEIPVDIVAGELTQVPPTKLEQGIILNETVIEAEYNADEARAINMMKMDKRIVNVLASDAMDKLPDRNVAEAVQRIPAIAIEKDQGEGRYVSVRGTPHDWSSALVNGNRLPVADEDSDSRTMSFDVLPTEMVEYIVVAKAITPDMEGDAIGGSIDFLTRSAPLGKVADLSIATGYNAQANKPTYNASFALGNRSKNKKWGGLVSGVLWHRNYGTDRYSATYGSNYSQGLNRFELRDYQGTRTTFGLTAAGEYNFSKTGSVYIKSLFGKMIDEEWNRKVMFNYATGAGKTYRQQHIHAKYLWQLFGGELGIKTSLTQTKKLEARITSYDNSFGYGDVPYGKGDDRNGYYVVQFESPNLQYDDMVYLDSEGNYLPTSQGAYTQLKLLGSDNPIGGDAPDNIQPMPSMEITDNNLFFIGAYTELNRTNEQDPIVAQFDITDDVTPRLQLKYGAKFRAKEGSRELGLHEWLQNFNTTSNPIYLSQFNTESLDLNGGFVEEIGAPYDRWFMSYMTPGTHEDFLNIMGDSLKERKMDSNHPEYEQWVGSSYSYKENVTSVYGMGDYKLSEKINFIGGLRIEYTDAQIIGDTVLWDQFDLTDFTYPTEEIVSNNEYWAILPMFHLKYAHTENLNFRAALTRTFRRPNFLEAKPGEPVRDLTNLEFIVGNSALKPTFSWNFDLMADYYFKKGGMASAGVFYKHVTDHIFATNTGDADPAKGIIYKSFQNAEESYILGAEFSFIHRFTFLPGIWKNFGLNTNLTLIKSEMKVPGRPESQPLPRQADFLFNAALTYEGDKFAVRLAWNYKGPYLMELNLAAVENNETGEKELLHLDTEYDIFMDQFSSLDLSMSYNISKKLTAFCDFNNLLNKPMYTYRGQTFRPVNVEYYSWKGQIGVKLSL